MYLLPAFWTSDRNTTPHSPNPANTVTTPQVLDSAELKFQISFKTKIAENLFGDNGDIWAGYTQSSRWQAYNSEDSRPFRETNYEPEVMMVFRNGYSIGGWRGRMNGIALNHQSMAGPTHCRAAGTGSCSTSAWTARTGRWCCALVPHPGNPQR